MKLVASNLVGAYEQTEELRRLEAVTENSGLLAEITELGQKIQGCIHLIDELNLARESLETAGYSTEWMDIINRDNNFLAVVDVDLPKFFGGDEAKQAACEGAIIDTIKKWAKAVWEWIKSLYTKIKKALVWIMGLWVHEGRPKGDLQNTYEKVIGLMEKNGGQTEAAVKYCFGDITQRDPDAIITIIQSYRALAKLVAGIGVSLYSGTPTPMTKELSEAIEREIDGAHGCVLQVMHQRWQLQEYPVCKLPPDLKHNGFIFSTSETNGIVFAPVCEDGDHIPKVTFGYSSFDKPKQEYYLKKLDEAAQAAYDAAKELDKYNKMMDDNKLAIQREINAMTSNVTVAPDDKEYQRKQAVLRNYTPCATIMSRIVVNLTKISSSLDRDQRTIKSRISAVLKDLKPEK